VTGLAERPTAAGSTPAQPTIGFANLLRSEWTKLRSLRSSVVCLGLLVLIMIGLAVAVSARWAHQSGPVPIGFDPTNIALSGVYLAEVVVGALGVMVISSEYATGMIRASFTAVPQRRAVLAAKAVVLTSAVLVVGEVLSFAAFGVSQLILNRPRTQVSLGDPGVLRAVTGAGLYLAAVALLGLGLGAALRHTAGAISAFFGLLFALNAVVDLLPTSWRNDIINYLPLNAGTQIFVVHTNTGALAPWTGLGVFAGYAAVALVLGFAQVELRDA
jgi:ABC-2 type transport system permease protein